VAWLEHIAAVAQTAAAGVAVVGVAEFAVAAAVVEAAAAGVAAVDVGPFAAVRLLPVVAAVRPPPVVAAVRSVVEFAAGQPVASHKPAAAVLADLDA